MKKDREKNSNIANAAIVGAVSEESALYASANKEYLAILDDKTLGRTLEGISEYKVNPKYQYQNINQQAGFSAELKEQAHVNAQNILMKNKNRLKQYDNLSVDQKAQIGERFPDYATPNKNHELVDHVMVDRKGNVIPGTLTQSKFVGRNGAECFEIFLSNKYYKKYLKNGVKIEIPKDFFGDFQKEANIKIKSLKSQIAKQKSFGDFPKAAKLEEKLQKCKTIKANTKSASITKEEAIYARNHPTLSTVKDMVSHSHQAGMNAAGVGVLVSGGVSLITNIYECVTKGKDPKEALKHTAIATLKGGSYGYGVAFSSSFLGGMMQNSANKLMQSLSKNAPAMIVGAAVANVTILARYLSGKIDEVELCKQLGRTNTSLLSGGAMAFAGQALIPIPVVGALIGGFVGAVLSEAFFNALNSKKVELARQRRIEIEKECRESIRLLEAYRNQFKEVFERYFHETTKFFNQSFDELERALYAGDADLAIGANNKIQEGLGQKPLFDNKQEGWELITSNKNIRM
ncbi:hypothetical protein KVE43_02980 [Helicobacter pylori]|nr:hypothetical protein KVE43_02980 [Helicobacter pylori]